VEVLKENHKGIIPTTKIPHVEFFFLEIVGPPACVKLYAGPPTTMEMNSLL